MKSDEKMRFKKITFGLLLLLQATLYSQTDVFTIARSGTVDQIQKIAINNPEMLNAKNEKGFTPLILACYSRNDAVSKFLIDNSTTINICSEMGSPLMASVVQGNTAITELLLQKGADPNLTDNKGTTALMYATQFQNAAAVGILLHYKADKALKDKEGKTAFEYAVFGHEESIINLLKN